MLLIMWSISVSLFLCALQLQTPASFAASIQELTIALQRSGDPGSLSKLTTHLDHLAAIDPSPGMDIDIIAAKTQAL